MLDVDGHRIALKRVAETDLPRCGVPNQSDVSLWKIACAFELAARPAWALEGVHRLAQIDDPRALYLLRVYAHVLTRRGARRP